MTSTVRGVGHIPPAFFERAEILMDQFRDIEDDRELIARVLMEVEADRRPMGLTPRQIEVLSFIRRHIETNGAAPSYSEIAGGLGFVSKGHAHALVRQLADRGAVRIGVGRARSIVVVGGV